MPLRVSWGVLYICQIISFPDCLKTYFSWPWDLSWLTFRLLNILSVKARLLGNWSLSSILLQECLQFNAALAPADLHVCCFTWKTFEKATQKVTCSNMLCKHGIFDMDQTTNVFVNISHLNLRNIVNIFIESSDESQGCLQDSV